MEKAVHKDQIYMKFKDILKKSLLEGLVQRNMGTAQLTTALLVTLLFAVYLFVIYRCMTRSTFYSRSFGISVSAMVLLTAGVLLALQSNFAISLGMVGSLSIVRFRTSVKDTMDQVFLLWGASLGILCGAGAYLTALADAFLVTVCFVSLTRLPDVRRPKLLSVVLEPSAEEELLLKEVRRFDRRAKLRACSVSSGENWELMIEVTAKRERELLEQIRGVDGVMSVMLTGPDGETTE